MDGREKDGENSASLEYQMKNLLKAIEAEPVTDELRELAEELQAALQRQAKPSGPQD